MYPPSAEGGQEEIISMTTAFVSNQEFKDATPGLDLSRYNPVTLSGVLVRSTARAERFLNYTLPFEVITGEKVEGNIDANGDLVIHPRKFPVRSVDSVQIVKGGFNATLDFSDRTDIPTRGDEVVVDGHTVIISNFLSINFTQLRFHSFYTLVNYQAGFFMFDRPEDLKDAIILYARDEVARSFNPIGASELRQGGVTIKYGNKSTIQGAKSDLVRDAEAILITYKRVAGW